MYPGDEIILKLKNGKIIKKTYVNNLFDGIVITHNDTIPFNTIDRIYFNQATRLNIIGGTLVFAGAALFVIDQVNNTIVHGNDFNLDDGVSIASISVIGVGLPMMLIKKKYRKLNYKHRLLVVKKGSIFYRPDPRGNMSPYLDN